jgi:hypothetical protein
MTETFTYVAILEFENSAGLEAYLTHPAHGELASQFFASFEQALMYDFELAEGQRGLDVLMEEEQRQARN